MGKVKEHLIECDDVFAEAYEWHSEEPKDYDAVFLVDHHSRKSAEATHEDTWDEADEAEWQRGAKKLNQMFDQAEREVALERARERRAQRFQDMGARFLPTRVVEEDLEQLLYPLQPPPPSRSETIRFWCALAVIVLWNAPRAVLASLWQRIRRGG